MSFGLLQIQKVRSILDFLKVRYKTVSHFFIGTVRSLKNYIVTLRNPLGIYDFNNLNSVNFNNNYFIDQFHFNYKVADCIITKIILDTSACGSDFGEFVDKRNIKKYKETIKEKFAKLRVGYDKPT